MTMSFGKFIYFIIILIGVTILVSLISGVIMAGGIMSKNAYFIGILAILVTFLSFTPLYYTFNSICEYCSQTNA